MQYIDWIFREFFEEYNDEISDWEQECVVDCKSIEGMDIIDPKVHYKLKEIVIAEKHEKSMLEPIPIIKQTAITARIETKIDR